MTTIKVASLNTQNKFNIKNYDGGYNAIKFVNLLTDYNIDILSTQELVRRYLNNIKKILVMLILALVTTATETSTSQEKLSF